MDHEQQTPKRILVVLIVPSFQTTVLATYSNNDKYKMQNKLYRLTLFGNFQQECKRYRTKGFPGEGWGLRSGGRPRKKLLMHFCAVTAQWCTGRVDCRTGAGSCGVCAVR